MLQATQDGIDTLRLGRAELREILQHRRHEMLRHESLEAWRKCRYAMPIGQTVPVLLGGSSLSGTLYASIGCDLSDTGASVLLGKFIYEGTPCMVVLTTREGEPLQLPGRVAHCWHVRGRVHEVSIKFDDPIRTSDFVPESSMVSPPFRLAPAYAVCEIDRSLHARAAERSAVAAARHGELDLAHELAQDADNTENAIEAIRRVVEADDAEAGVGLEISNETLLRFGSTVAQLSMGIAQAALDGESPSQLRARVHELGALLE